MSDERGTGWIEVMAVLLVTLLTATSVGVLVAARHGRPQGSVASAPRLISPTPEGTSSPTALAASEVQLSVPSSRVVWELVDYTRLFRSTDQGGHWYEFSIPTEPGIRPSISFIDDHEGWLLAPGSPATQCEQAGVAVWHTTDSGKTWTRLAATGIASKQCKELVYFADARHGFVTAWDANHSPTVYATADGGATWRASTVPDNPIFTTRPGGFALRVDWIKSFGGVTYLEATGAQQDPTWPTDFIYISTNGGAGWTWKQKVPSHELVLVTQQRWLEIDPPGQLDESTNGGQSMAPFRTDLRIDQSAAPGQILFGDANVGYVSRGGALQLTTDGGTHWSARGLPGSSTPSPAPTPQSSPGYFMPTAVLLDAPTANVVWAFIPYDKVLFVSTDRGDHWEARNLPPDESTFPNVTFLDGSEGWYLGSAGGSGDCASDQVKIWHTVDGAQTWQPVAVSGISDAQCKQNLVFVDRDHAFTSSEEQNMLPRVYRSADGGHTWSVATLSDPASFESVHYGYAFSAGAVKSFGSTLLLEAGGNGFLSTVAGSWVYRSDDGGAHWVLAASLGASPDSVVFMSPTHWLRVQGPSGSLQTFDSGKTWQAFSTNYDDAAGVPSTFVFADPQVGYGTVRGSFHRTVDGGAHWTTPATPWMPPA